MTSRKTKAAQTSRAEHNLEISTPMVADRISRTANVYLVRIRPTLRRWAIPREARLAGALLGAPTVRDRVDTDANIAIATFHDGEIIRSAIFAGILAVAELEKCLCFPLAGGAPFCVTGETHTKVFKGRSDGEFLLWGKVCWLRTFDHPKITCDLVESELFGEGAVVPDIDVESIGGTVLEKCVVDWRCCSRQGEQRG